MRSVSRTEKKGIEDQFLRHDAEQAARLPVILDDIVAKHRQAAGIGAHQPGQRRDQRRLAGAVRAEQAEELALGDFERNTVQRAQRAEILDDVNDGNSGGHGYRLRRGAEVR